jgi:Putative Actinobacterial Holin-X, holin superfamily III
METQQPKNALESLLESTSTYIDTRVELTKLKTLKKSSDVFSTLASQLIIGGVGFIFLMLLNIALGLWLGELLGKTYYAFFLLAFTYFIVGLILYISRDKWIKSPLANTIIKKLNE